MAREIQTHRWPAAPADEWPPDDTEESVCMGILLHQTTITNVRWGINEAARVGLALGQPPAWSAMGQTLLLGCVRYNGTAYRTMPDVFIYPREIDMLRGSVSIADEGPPLLTIEVLSEDTFTWDLNVDRGKGYSYAHAGIQEYVALDPTGTYLEEGIRAWRLDGGVYRRVELGANRRWQSAQIGIAIGLEGLLATVYARDGQRMPREGEVVRELARRDAELARRDAELAQRREELNHERQLRANAVAELEALRRRLEEQSTG